MTSDLRAETIHFDSYDGHSVEAYLAAGDASGDPVWHARADSSPPA